MAYTTSADVLQLLLDLDIGTSRLDPQDVDQTIAELEGLVNGALVAQGYDPVPVTAAVLNWSDGYLASISLRMMRMVFAGCPWVRVYLDATILSASPSTTALAVTEPISMPSFIRKLNSAQ